MKYHRTEGKDLNGALSVITVVKLLLVAVGVLLPYILMFVLRLVYGTGAEGAYEAFASSETLSGQLLDVIFTTLCVFVPLALYFFFSRKSFADVVPMEKPTFMQVGYGVGATVIIGLAASFVGILLLTILFAIFGMGDKFIEMNSVETVYPENIWLVMLMVLSMSVMPALLEEFLMRGVALNATKKFGTAFSLLFSGFFFAFLHNTWVQVPFAFVLGMVFAYFTLRFRTIWIAVISHFVYNFNSVILSLILQHGDEYGIAIVGLWEILFLTLMLGLFIAGLIIYGVKKPDLPKSEIPSSRKFVLLLRSPFLYVFIALAVFRLVYALL